MLVMRCLRREAQTRRERGFDNVQRGGLSRFSSGGGPYGLCVNKCLILRSKLPRLEPSPYNCKQMNPPILSGLKSVGRRSAQIYGENANKLPPKPSSPRLLSEVPAQDKTQPSRLSQELSDAKR